ncbi:MAG TPA: hypothetical protein VGE64_08950 [Xanthomonadaceae bacterium]
MKHWSRPVLYSAVVILAVMAYLAPPKTEDDLLVNKESGVSAKPRRQLSSERDADAFIAIAPRRSKPMVSNLFPAEPKPQPVHVEKAVDAVPLPSPMPEFKVLGWMELETVPHVFIELSGESHTLSPGEAIADVYRFEKMGAGVAVFTYLPDGRVREFAVSDPALSE